MSDSIYSITAECPECGSPLKLRRNREAGNQFLGCSGYPECKHTEEYEAKEQALAQQIVQLEDELSHALQRLNMENVNTSKRLKSIRERLQGLIFECHPDRNGNGLDAGAVTRQLIACRSVVEAA